MTYQHLQPASSVEVRAGRVASKAVTPAGRRDALTHIDIDYFGNVGGGADATSVLQAALDEASTWQVGASLDRIPEVHLRPDTYYNVSQITVPQNVRLRMMGSELRGMAAGAVVALSDRAEIEDGQVRGEVANLATNGVSISSTSDWATVRRVSFNGFQGAAISVAGPAARIVDVFAQNCVLDDGSLASPTGALHIEGTQANDIWVLNSEFTVSNTAMSASGNAYAVVALGKTASFSGVVAEISDHGFYVNGVHLKFSNCRADLNRGHGWVFAGGDGDLSSCSSLSNGRETTNTYDGYYITGGSYRFAACSANVLSTLTAVQHRYGFNDASSVTNTGSVFDASCWSDQHATKAINVPDPGGKVVCTDGPFINITANATTWDVQTYRWPHNCWNLTATSATNFSTLTNGVPGQRVVLRGDGNTTLVHNGAFGANTLRMLGGANVLTAAHTLYQFVFVGGGFWVQI